MDNLIMLPTGKPAQRGQLVLTPDGLRKSHNHDNQVYKGKTAQHLYQIAKAPIQPKDHYLLDMNAGHGERDWELLESPDWEDAKRATGHPIIKKACWKIIASTDPTLGVLPIDPEVIDSLVKTYNA